MFFSRKTASQIRAEFLDLHTALTRTESTDREISVEGSSPYEGLPIRFIEYVKKTQFLEGGWSNNPSDPGGATMFGLSARANPSLRREIESRSLSKRDAMNHIYNKYYRGMVGVDEIDPRIGFIVFDARFHGMKEIIKQLQKVLNDLHVSNLIVDGIWGRKTANATMLLNKHQVDFILQTFESQSFLAASDAASRVLIHQRKNSMPTHNFTKAFARRNNLRIAFGRGLGYV